MVDFKTIFTPEVISIIQIFAIFLALIHFIVMVIMYQQVLAISRIVHTPNSSLFRFLGLLQTLALAAILFLLIFY
jgi:DMSO/TMAO reductase YedYZ heme-binding membrane subunit